MLNTVIFLSGLPKYGNVFRGKKAMSQPSTLPLVMQYINQNKYLQFYLPHCNTVQWISISFFINQVIQLYWFMAPYVLFINHSRQYFITFLHFVVVIWCYFTDLLASRFVPVSLGIYLKKFLNRLIFNF